MLANFIAIVVPILSGFFGYVLGQFQYRRQVNREWAKERSSEISEQREDMHEVLFLEGERSSVILETTIDYRFRKLFASIENSPLLKLNLVRYEVEVKKLFASNTFDRRNLTKEQKDVISVEINKICVSLNSLLEAAAT